MLKTKYIILYFIFLLCSAKVWSTHIVGGELYYEHIGGNQYEVTLKVYRDCGPTNINGTGFDEFAAVGIFENGSLHDLLDMSLFNASVNFVPVVLDNPCFIVPPDLCVEEAVYTDIISLPPSANGYDLVYQRCCRNPSIINIIFPEDAGVTFWAHIPGTDELDGNNSSPVFDNFPPVSLCTGAQFFFDHAATDPDGDSLVYEFCTPLHGASPDFPAPSPPEPPPFIDVTWEAGYSDAYPIDSDPPFEINPETGFITGTATQTGQYVMGVCVKEYRDGVFLSQSTRDFQFNVSICDPNVTTTIPEQTQFCDGLTFEFDNITTNANDFYWDFGDPNSDTDFSTDPSPTYTYSDTGTYVVTLIANPGWTCADTAYAEYEVFPLINPGIINSNFECIDDVGYFDFEAEGAFGSNADFSWTFETSNGDIISELQNPNQIIFSDPGDYQISLTIFDNDCESSVEESFSVPEPPVAGIIAQDDFCNGFTYDFQNSSTNSEEYYWDFGVLEAQNDFSIEDEPSFTYPGNGNYQVTLTASAPMTCPDVTSTNVEIFTLLDPNYPELDPQCFEGNSYDFEAQGSQEPNAVFFWDFGPFASPQTSTLENPNNVVFSEPGDYEVTLTISENGCEESFTDIVEVIQNPSIGFSIENMAGCAPYNAHFINDSWADGQIFYLWNFGDGQTSTASDPYHIYENTGSYDVTLTITTSGGCAEILTMTLEDVVTVYPTPIADFEANPKIVNILESTVFITDNSIGSTSCTYIVSDGTQLDDCNTSHTFTEGGYFEITQYVVNSYGCTDRAVILVGVEGFLFYAPNAFSPNDDGINDVYLPSTIGATSYELIIYNRWGEVFFETNDYREAWTGNVKGGEHFAQDGVYIYHVVIHDLLGKPHEYTGHITLFR